MDEDDVQRPLHYAALRRSPTTKPGAKQLFAKAACGVDDPAPKAVPLNDRRADIFGNTEFLHGLGECDVARRRSIGGYLIVEQRQNREFHNYSEFNWSRLASDANGDTVPRTQTIYTYQLTDPLGSVAVQVRMIDNNTYTANATQSERNPRYLNFDAHGKQRAGSGRTAVDNNGDSDTIDPGEEALTAWQPLSYFSEQRTRPEGTWQGYAGHETYNSVGIVHMKGRIYDPTLGRFLQPDPIVEDDLNPQTWNRYTYVRNNPMTFTDPTGFATQCGERCLKRKVRDDDFFRDTGGGILPGGSNARTSDKTTPSGATEGSTTNSVFTHAWTKYVKDAPDSEDFDGVTNAAMADAIADLIRGTGRRVSDGTSPSGTESAINQYLQDKMKFVDGPDGRLFSATDLTMSHDPSISREDAEEYASLASSGWTVSHDVDGEKTASHVSILVSGEAPNLASGGADLHLSPCVGRGCAQYGQALLGGRILFRSPGQLPTTPPHEMGHIFGLGHDATQYGYSGTIMSRSFNRSVMPADINRLFELYGK